MTSKLCEIGRSFEKIAVKILKKERYVIVEETSSIFWASPYDIVVNKNGKEYYVEVRGRKNGKDINEFNISTNKVRRLKELKNDVLIMLINREGYELFPLEKIDLNKKIFKINNKKLRIIKKGNNTPKKVSLSKKDIKKMKKIKTRKIKRWINDKLVSEDTSLVCGYCNSTQIYVTSKKDDLYFCRSCGKTSKLVVGK